MSANCNGTSQPGLIPATDLAGGTYTDPQGGVHPGGLYDTGSNSRPPEIDAAMPAVTAVGKVLGCAFMGGSTIRRIGDEVLPVVLSDPLKNSKVKFANGGVNGMRTDKWANPGNICWNAFATRLADAGIKPSQLRVVFFMDFVNAGTGTFEGEVTQTAAWIEAVLTNIHAKYPSVQSVYLASHHYVGYADLVDSADIFEPLAYWNAWSIQRAVRFRVGTAAPWAVVGPYVWTNGDVPRSDGRVYICTDFQQEGASAGVHLEPIGAAKAADDFVNFLHNDASASWYRG